MTMLWWWLALMIVELCFMLTITTLTYWSLCLIVFGEPSLLLTIYITNRKSYSLITATETITWICRLFPVTPYTTPIPTLHPVLYDLMYVAYEFFSNQVFFFHLVSHSALHVLQFLHSSRQPTSSNPPQHLPTTGPSIITTAYPYLNWGSHSLIKGE